MASNRAPPERSASSMPDSERLREMRRAGHAVGLIEAERAIASTIGRYDAQQHFERIITDRSSALIALGAADHEVAAWIEMCKKSFWSRIDRMLAKAEARERRGQNRTSSTHQGA